MMGLCWFYVWYHGVVCWFCVCSVLVSVGLMLGLLWFYDGVILVVC